MAPNSKVSEISPQGHHVHYSLPHSQEIPGCRHARAQGPRGSKTKAGTTVIDLFDVLRELGLADQAAFYELFLERKYEPGTKGLSAEQITEQFVNLSRCKRDSAMLKQLLD